MGDVIAGNGAIQDVHIYCTCSHSLSLSLFQSSAMRHLVCSTVLVQLTIAAIYVVRMDHDQCTIANHQKDWGRLLEGTTSPYQRLFAIFPACLAKLVLVTMKAKAGCKFRNVRKRGHTANGKQSETHQTVWTFQLRTAGTAVDTWPNTWPELSGTNLPNLIGACPKKTKVSRSAMWKSKSTGISLSISQTLRLFDLRSVRFLWALASSKQEEILEINCGNLLNQPPFEVLAARFEGAPP